MYRPVWSLPMIQRRTGWKCCGQMRPKSSFLASTLLAVFGGRGMLNTIPTVKHGGGNIMLWGVFLLRGQDNCTASKGRWKGPCTIRTRALKPARALKVACGWVFQHDNDPKQWRKKYLIPCWFCMFAHWQRNYQSIIFERWDTRQQRSDSRRSTLRSWSGLASLQTVIP